MNRQAILDRWFPSIVARELFELMLGEQLGEGIGRTVMAFGKDKVVKIETPRKSFQNINEWDTWRTFKDTEVVSRWLAPCHEISDCGVILIQARTKPIPTRRLPAQIPDFISDVKAENWGFFRGRPVVHDYGILEPDYRTRLKKAVWQ